MVASLSPFFRLVWFLVASLPAALLAADGAPATATVTEKSRKSTRVLSHLPEVPQPPVEVPADYRAAITASAQRYETLYTAARLTDAIAEARAGIALAEAAQRPRDEAEFLKAALYASWLMGESTAGFDYGQRLLQRAEQFDDDRLRSVAHRVIGSIFGQLRNREKRIEHVKLAISAAERVGDSGLRLAALNNYGNILMHEGDFDAARRIHEEVLAYREANGQLWDAAGSLTNLGDIAERVGDLPLALRLQERALALRTELDDRRGQVRSLAQVSGVLRQLGRFDEALARATEARTRAKAIGGHELLNLVYGELARIHEGRREFAEALTLERLASREREIMAGDQARVRAAEFEARHELDRKEKAIQELDRERVLQAAELKFKEAEILRQKAELNAQQAAASSARWQRVTLLGILAIGGVAVYATVSRQRLRLAAERRIHAETLAAKEVAEQANALKSRLIGIVSHDIRSPLSSVLSLTEEMRAELPPGRRDERLDIITHQTDLVVSLAQDLLDATALEAGGMKLDAGPVELNEVTRAALGHFSLRAEAKNQRLSFHPALDADLHLTGDATKLHQVVTNLVSNALKYSPAGASITVATARQGDTLSLRVTDEGPGVSPDEISRLFQPFTQLRAKPTGGESSHGLGLSIAHQLVRLHGGTIRVEPAQPGGSVFIVELPASPA
jgi:signal transduction histidine kinase